MKKIIASTALLVVSFNALATVQDYPHPEDFTEYDVRGTGVYILKDNRYGCEYTSRWANDSYVLRQGSCNPSVKEVPQQVTAKPN